MAFTDFAPDQLTKVVQFTVDDNYSFERVNLNTGQNLKMGAVLAQLKTVPTTGAAHADNTGAGTCTGVTASNNVKIGTYKLIATTAGAAAVFNVISPDGTSLANATTDVAYTSGEINFTINDGDPDFAIGDIFLINVTADAVTAIDFGSANFQAIGVLAMDTDATSADTATYMVARAAIVNDTGLIYPSGATDTEKAGAKNDLKRLGIVVEEAA